MASIQERLQLKRVPLDTWNVREQLCLASAVARSGDQNWMSVSRALKSVGDPNRPADWYSQKSCAAQYGELLEHVETPKRKKRNSEGAGETPQESILKRLTQERIAEINKNVAEINQQYSVLQNEISELRNPNISEDRLREMWSGIEAATRARERETARRTAWLREREERRARAERAGRVTQPVPQNNVAVPSSAAPSSPLLTSLLKSSPVVTTPQHISHPANSVDSMSPSAGAPTLSMLLEKSTPTPTQQHDNKHAAIEHIKSQLVQIEQQLKANPTPVASLPPPLDIDDIEIKAEDVYAFRDIDIEIPPVASMHKTSPARVVEKPVFIKNETEIRPTETELLMEHNIESDFKIREQEAATEEIINVETTPEEQTPVIIEETLKPEVLQVTPEKTEVNISFPEVKFPTPEIKVIQPEELKIKEEIREVEPEPTPFETHQEDNQIPIEVPAIEESTVPEETIIEEPESIQPSQATSAEVAAQEEEICTKENVNISEVIENNTEEIADQTEVQETVEHAPPKEDEQPTTTEQEPETTQAEVIEPPIEQIEEKKQDGDAPVEVKEEPQPEEPTPLKEVEQAPEIHEESATETEIKEEKEIEDTHTETDDDTPMELVREEEKDGKKKKDYSRKKKPDSRTCSGSESAAETSAPDSPNVSDAERQRRMWRKSVMMVYSRLAAHKYASLFLRPISDSEAPGYSQVVKRPMDLGTIKKNIDNGVIRTTAEFQRDVLLMLTNALMYNSSEHRVYQMAKEMFHDAESQLGMLLAAQAHAGLSAAPRRRRRDVTEQASPASAPLGKRRHDS